MTGFSAYALPDSYGSDSFSFGIRLDVPNNDYQSFFLTENTATVEWELLLGPEPIEKLSSITITFNNERLAGQYADARDFSVSAVGNPVDSPLKGTATFNLQNPSFKLYSFKKHEVDSYELDEIYGIRISNPSRLGIKSDSEYIFKINRSSQNNPYHRIGLSDITLTEGQAAPEIVVNSNFKESYFSDTETPVAFSIEDRDNLYYAGHSDFQSSTFSKSIPLFNGGRIKLDDLLAVEDNLEEGDDSSGAPDGKEYASVTASYSDYGLYKQYYLVPIKDPDQNSRSKGELYIVSASSFYTKRSADIITNYDPQADGPIQIDLDSFEDASDKLKIAKKSKRVAKLAKKNVDFIYDHQAGYLYYNENGKQDGFGDGGIFAILEGKLNMGKGNFDFI